MSKILVFTPWVSNLPLQNLSTLTWARAGTLWRFFIRRLIRWKIALGIFGVVIKIVLFGRASSHQVKHHIQKATPLKHGVVTHAAVIGEINSTDFLQNFHEIQPGVGDLVVVEVNPLQFDGEAEKVAGNFLDFVAGQGEVKKTTEALQGGTAELWNAAIVALKAFQKAKTPANVEWKFLDVAILNDQAEDVVVGETGQVLAGVVDDEGRGIGIVDDFADVAAVAGAEGPSDVAEVAIDAEGGCWGR